MKSLTVNAGRGTPIYIENNLLNSAGARIRAVSAAQKACIVSDSNVFPLYGEVLTQQLNAVGFAVCSFVFPAGEAAKTTDTVIRMAEVFAENELTREDLVVALGGGVTGDMAGFAAAIYLRSIDIVQIPTSLLAQVDASVGGKTAVNLPQGKNLVGAFHQPSLVLIDPTVLRTLPPRYFADGMAEAVKMGCIKSAALLDKIAAGNSDATEDIIEACVRLKAEVVARDEQEHGERALLNFGHTVGHAIEKLHGFSGISHGEAVAVGMVTVCRAAERNGLTEPGTADKIAAVLRQCGLPTAADVAIEEIIKAMCADKKRTGDAINLILIHQIGEGVIHPISFDDLPAFFGVSE